MTAAGRDKAQAALVAAQERLRLADAARFRARSARDAAITRAEHALRQTAPPALAEFVSELETMLNRERQRTVNRDEQREFDGRSGTYRTSTTSTHAGQVAHLRALRQAIDEVRGWMLEALTTGQFDERIAAMRARIERSRQQSHEFTPTAARKTDMMTPSTIWAIDERWLGVLQDAADRLRAGDSIAAIRAANGRATREGRDSTATRGMAVIPITGVLERRLSWIAELFGGTSLQQVGADIRRAMSAREVDGIALLIDSPGGSVDGTEELAATIRAARERKPVIAVIDGLCASAAYYIGSQASHITISPSGATGSIGVFYAHVSIARALQDDGVDVTMIRSVPAKAEGYAALSLTREAQSAIQADVDEFHARFVRDVALGRGVSEARVRSAYGQGRTVLAPAALRTGMVDLIAAPDAALGLAAEYTQRVTAASERRRHAYELAMMGLEDGRDVALPPDVDVPFVTRAAAMSGDAQIAEDGYDDIARAYVGDWEQTDREARID